jgi:hypothetical protein
MESEADVCPADTKLEIGVNVKVNVNVNVNGNVIFNINAS